MTSGSNTFNVLEYLNDYYTFDRNDKCLMQSLYRCQKFLYDEINKDTCPTGRLIEFGSGPIITKVVSASKKFQHIVCTDVFPENVDFIKKWIIDDKIFDFTLFFEIESEFESERKSVSVPELMTRVKKAIKEVLVCDVLQQNPFAPNVYEPFDAMFLPLVLDAACKDFQEYKKVLKRLVDNYLRQGGLLYLQTGTTSDSVYRAGEEKYEVMEMTMGLVQKACQYAGLRVNRHEEVVVQDEKDGRIVDIKMSLVVAYKE